MQADDVLVFFKLCFVFFFFVVAYLADVYDMLRDGTEWSNECERRNESFSPRLSRLIGCSEIAIHVSGCVSVCVLIVSAFLVFCSYARRAASANHGWIYYTSMSPFALCHERMPRSFFNDHVTKLSLLLILRQANCILVKGSYLADLADQGQQLPRRQEVPEKAVVQANCTSIYRMIRTLTGKSRVLRIGAFIIVFALVFLMVFTIADAMWPLPNVPRSYMPWVDQWDTNDWTKLDGRDLKFELSCRAFKLVDLAIGLFFLSGLCLGLFLFRIDVVVISYLWIDPEHPDVNGDQLKFLGHMLKAYGCERGDDDLERVAVFIDCTSMYQHTSQYFPCTIIGIQAEGEKNTFKVRLTQSGDIVDDVDPSLMKLLSAEASRGPHVGDAYEVRVPRDSEQDNNFKLCLKYSINLLYGSSWSTVWMLTKPPPNRSGGPSREYDESGWCTTERAISSVIKPSDAVLDLGRVYPDIMETRPADINWIEDVVKVCTTNRRPPLAPTQFNAVIRSKVFTNGADVDVVQRIYKNAYDNMIGTAARLDFSSLSWTDADMESLATVLDDCRHLRVLALSDQDITDRGMESLMASLKNVTTLEELRLNSTRISHTFIYHMWENLPNLDLLRWSSVETDSTISI